MSYVRKRSFAVFPLLLSDDWSVIGLISVEGDNVLFCIVLVCDSVGSRNMLTPVLLTNMYRSSYRNPTHPFTPGRLKQSIEKRTLRHLMGAILHAHEWLKVCSDRRAGKKHYVACPASTTRLGSNGRTKILGGCGARVKRETRQERQTYQARDSSF